MIENPKNCQECMHYRRHYVKIGREFYEIHDGHCVYPRMKRRRAEDDACLLFELQDQAAD